MCNFYVTGAAATLPQNDEILPLQWERVGVRAYYYPPRPSLIREGVMKTILPLLGKDKRVGNNQYPPNLSLMREKVFSHFVKLK